MKGNLKMIINPSMVELVSRELHSDRMREAEKQRLIKQAVGRNPSPAVKLLVVIHSRWNEFWSRVFKKQSYIPISQMPKKSHSL